MSRRIEIELTSTRPDGSWTWRAAGAREPKGTLDGSLLHAEAKPGDVLRAEAEFELEGISIISVAVPKVDDRQQPQRIEVVGPSRPDTPGVTTQLAGRADQRPGDRRRDRDDGRPGRRDRDGARPQGRGREAGRDGEKQHRPRSEEESSRPGRPERPHRGEGGAPTSERPHRGDRGGHAREEGGTGRGRRPEGGPPPDRRRAGGERERPKVRRFHPGNIHRQAVMESLPAEQKPVAEQVLRGGIPAVRTAIHLEREKAAAEGRPAPNADELIAMAEALLPRIKAAEWRDRAEAAAADPDGISLRDLRSVVAGADVARDEETRALAANLREALERRATKLHQDWADEVGRHLDSGHVVRALRLSARPPEPSARLDTALNNRLAEAAGEAMSPGAAPDLWAALLDAAAASPVRRSIKPAGLPENAPPELKRAAHQQSGSIPALAKLLGVTIPPPPRPAPARPRPTTRPGRSGDRPARGAGEAGVSEPEARSEDTETSTSPQPVPEPAGEAPPGAVPEPAAGDPSQTSAEGGENSVVVEELGEPLGEAQVRELG